ncbi:hypothetical protein IB223_17830 [Pseudoxanthomonas sp. PXM03]|uniref:hypothetical protein n=1 Tax=Pseudoxanthomonas sp. PXM03 TaxID=2769284 RepID=UPI001784D310|nr:hypothetical protein [Pseudoxanthomonas sp. PXM03]MBD9437963.1 hypothetical protein [Pseudoxanthomonas sp. PXM03]
MRDTEGLDIYLQLAAQDRDHDRDGQLLARLSQLAREMEPNSESDQFGSIDIDNCLHAIAQSPLLFPTALARWLTTDSDVRLGKALLHHANITHLDQHFPQPYDLTRVLEDEAITTARRACALAAAPSVSLGWTLSMARDFPGSDEVRNCTTELLDYHVEQLLVSTVELLGSPDSSFLELDVSTETLRKAREVQQVLDELPRLRELEMTADMRLLYSSLKRSEHREIHRRAEESSAFRGLLHEVRLKYTSRPVIEVPHDSGTEEMTLAMSSHELAIEPPLSELTDPVLGLMRRNQLWRSTSS